MTSETETSPEAIQQSPGFLWNLVTILIVLVNASMACVIGVYVKGRSDEAFLTGYISGNAVIYPLLVVALFQIGKRFRNTKSRIKIFFWTSVVILLSMLGNLGDLAN